MATPAELLTTWCLFRRSAETNRAGLLSASNSAVIVLKNNAPYRVITPPDEYAYLSVE
ncbi:MAG: hypothetical protein ACLSVD_04575 [Eggerthellaceae bacterium]